MEIGFGARLKELRERKNLTQKEVAHMLKVSRTSIVGYEQNDKIPKLEKLKRLAQIYGTSVDYMLGFDNRKCFYLDGLSEKQQEIIIDFIENIKLELK